MLLDAYELACQPGNQDTADLLAKVVDVIDPAPGTSPAQTALADASEKALDTRSSNTVRVNK